MIPISPRDSLIASVATIMMLNAIMASIGGRGSCTTCRHASASVIECATVKAVIVPIACIWKTN